jgi:hypothetical protein
MATRPAARPGEGQRGREARLAGQAMICKLPAAPLGQGDELPRSVCMLSGHERIYTFALAKVGVRNPQDSRGGTTLHIEHTPGVANLAEPRRFHLCNPPRSGGVPDDESAGSRHPRTLQKWKPSSTVWLRGVT